MAIVIQAALAKTKFLDEDGNVSRHWLLALSQLFTLLPEDPNALLSLTIQEAEPADRSAEEAARIVLATQPEPPANLLAVPVEELQALVALVDAPPPPLELVDGQHIKSQSVTTGSVPASSYASVTLTWTTPFWDANYQVWVAVLEATASENTLRVHHVESISSTQVVVGVFNGDALGAHTGTLVVLGIHG